MTPEQLLNAVSTSLRQSPPAGLTSHDVEGFLSRQQDTLLRQLRSQFERLCRPDALLPSVERSVGYFFQRESASTQLPLFALEEVPTDIYFLAVKVRCHPMNPVKARQFAVHARGMSRWRILPREEWHGSPEAAITAFAQAHAHEARWEGRDFEDGSDADPAPFLLTDPLAIEVARKVSRDFADGPDIEVSSGATEEWLARPALDLQLDPVIAELIDLGGLRRDLLSDIARELRPKARAIPGFLRADGKTWLELATLHYSEPGEVEVVEELPPDHWLSDISYETPDSYRELIHFALDNSFPAEEVEEDDEDEAVERLCGCGK